MDTTVLIEKSQKMLNRIIGDDGKNYAGIKAEACELFRRYGGKSNSFLELAQHEYGINTKEQLIKLLHSFIRFVEEGLHSDISPRQEAQIDVVSDLLEQAQILMSTSQVHPAAPAIVAGATLEEFLRNWVEREELDLGDKRPSLEVYSGLLRAQELIDKQDAKDITSWAGIRNDAAHGHWDKVENPQKVEIMLAGIDLFVRKYVSK